ncbi:hypothetical protein Trydic_g960 [Trypoxylus dichotomus]
MCDKMASINLEETIVGIFMDLTNVLDSVCWSKLLQKLEILGIREIGLHLVNSYLTNRQQRAESIDVKIGQHIYSGWLTTMRGVPQSSILGPLLFLLYANDLSQISQHQTTLYAENTSVNIGERNDNPENEVVSWIDHWQPVELEEAC